MIHVNVIRNVKAGILASDLEVLLWMLSINQTDKADEQSMNNEGCTGNFKTV